MTRLPNSDTVRLSNREYAFLIGSLVFLISLFGTGWLLHDRHLTTIQENTKNVPAAIDEVKGTLMDHETRLQLGEARITTLEADRVRGNEP